VTTHVRGVETVGTPNGPRPAHGSESGSSPVRSTTPIEPCLAAEPLNTSEALKRILAILNRVTEDADRKKILAALAALA
jgi:hypothetical protein